MEGVMRSAASRDKQTLNLSRNVSKFYALQAVSSMNARAAKPKFVAQSRPALYYSREQS